MRTFFNNLPDDHKIHNLITREVVVKTSSVKFSSNYMVPPTYLPSFVTHQLAVASRLQFEIF